MWLTARCTFAWSALRLFMSSIPACDWSIWLFWFTSLWREASQLRGSPPLKVNVEKYFNLYNYFNSWTWSNHAKLSLRLSFRFSSLHCCALKIVTLLLKNWTLNICSVQIQWGFLEFPILSRVLQCRLMAWVSALSGSAAGNLRPKEMWAHWMSNDDN